RQFRKHHRIRAEPALPGLFNSVQAGDYLGVAANHVRRLASDGLVDRNQVLPMAPWRLRKSQLDSVDVRSAIARYLVSPGDSDGVEPVDNQLALFDGPGSALPNGRDE
ncbi:MAG: hypothetical protein ACI9WU_000340, partial [Myxococcota bacterium]